MNRISRWEWHRPLLGLLLALASLVPLHAAPVPHPDRPDRLVETRDGFSVEYSPGQEAWLEMAFTQLQAAARRPVTTPPTLRKTGPAMPGSARDLRANHEVLLAAIARQIGLPAPTELQGRTFDTFLGYYDLMTEVMQTMVAEFSSIPPARHLAIWQRDDLVGRLRSGAKIEGMSYDPATDSGKFDFSSNLEFPAFKERAAAILAAINEQRLKHSFNYDAKTASAKVILNTPPDAPKAVTPGSAPAETATGPEPVIAIIYRGDASTAPTEEAFAYIDLFRRGAASTMAEKAAGYRNPTIVSIILHETAEVGLVENIIASRDRRWLCDGTANYVAWRVARDLFGDEFARQAYDLDAHLRLHAAQQPKIDLTGWSAVENEKEGQAGTDLNRAHYTFATRAMFLLAERHGETALAQLWTDVARTPKKKASAKTFAHAYRKRFKGNLDSLIVAAEDQPIPAAVASAPEKP